MMFGRHPVVIRGGGDLATGVAWRLNRAGFPVVVCELAEPLTVRRTVALSSAVLDESVTIEGLVGRRIDNLDELIATALAGVIPVVVSPGLPPIDASVVVDARLAKVNIDTTIDDAETVIGLGPGFTAGIDCHAAVETKRGHHLGRVIWEGSPAVNTGTPGIIGGRGSERVLRAPVEGRAEWECSIGDVVTEGDRLGSIGGVAVSAPFDGAIRGLITSAATVGVGVKIGDVDPRPDASACHEISDKALAVGGGVVEAVLSRLGSDLTSGSSE